MESSKPSLASEHVWGQPQLVEALMDLVQTALFLEHHSTCAALPDRLAFRRGSDTYLLLTSALPLEQLALRTWQSWRMLEPHAPFVQYVLSALHITRFAYGHSEKKVLADLWMECFQRPSFRFQNLEKLFESWQRETPWTSLEIEKNYAKMALKVLIDGLPQKSALKIKLQVILFILRKLLCTAKESPSTPTLKYVSHIQVNFKSAMQLIAAKEAPAAYRGKLCRALLCMLPKVIYNCSGDVFFELFQFFQTLIAHGSKPGGSMKFEQTVATHFLKASERNEMLLSLDMLCQLYNAWKDLAKKLALEAITLLRMQEVLLRRILCEIKLNHAPLEDCEGGLLYFKYLEPIVDTPHFGALKEEIAGIFIKVFESSQLEPFFKCTSAKMLKNAAKLACRLNLEQAAKSISPNLQKLAGILISHSELSLGSSLALLANPATENLAFLLLRCIAHNLASPSWLSSRGLMHELVHKFCSIESEQKYAPRTSLRLDTIMKEGFSNRSRAMSNLVEFLSEYSLELAEEALELFGETLGEYFDMCRHSLICRQVDTGISSRIERAFKIWRDLKPAEHNLGYLNSGNKFLTYFLSLSGEGERLSHVVTGIFQMLDLQQKDIVGWPALRKKHVFEKLSKSLSYLVEPHHLPLVTKVWDQMLKCQLLNAESTIPLHVLYDKVFKFKEIPLGTWKAVKKLLETKMWNKDIARLYFELVLQGLIDPPRVQDVSLESLLIPIMHSHADDVSIPEKGTLLKELLAFKKYEWFSAIWLKMPELCHEAQICVKMLEAASKSGDENLMEVIGKTVIDSELLVSYKFDGRYRFEAFNFLCIYLFQIAAAKLSRQRASKHFAGNLDAYSHVLKSIAHQISKSMSSEKDKNKKSQLFDQLINLELNIGSWEAFQQACGFFLQLGWQQPSWTSLIGIFKAAMYLKKQGMDLDSCGDFDKIYVTVNERFVEYNLLKSWTPSLPHTLEILHNLAMKDQNFPQPLKNDKVSIEERLFRKRLVIQGLSAICTLIEGLSLACLGMTTRVTRIIQLGVLADPKKGLLLNTLIATRRSELFAFSIFSSTLRGCMHKSRNVAFKSFAETGCTLLITSLAAKILPVNPHYLFDGYLLANAAVYIGGSLVNVKKEFTRWKFKIHLPNLERLAITGIAIAVDSYFKNFIIKDLIDYINAHSTNRAFLESHFILDPISLNAILQGRATAVEFDGRATTWEEV